MTREQITVNALNAAGVGASQALEHFDAVAPRIAQIVGILAAITLVAYNYRRFQIASLERREKKAKQQNPEP